MMHRNINVRQAPPASEQLPGAEEMTELVLDLPLREVTALEEVARQRGLTTGELLRRLIPIFLACMADAPAMTSGRGVSR